MTRSLRHRRRAERFAQLLEEADGGRRQHLRSPLDEELVELVNVRHRLAATPPAEVDPEFRTGLRAMLVATAEREGIGVTAGSEPEPRPAPRPARRPASVLARGPRARTAVIAGVAVGAVAFAGMSTASENAVPGDALYGVKRSTERAQLALASSNVGRAQLYLDFARTRLAEAQAVTTGLDRVLDDMDRETAAGVRLLTTAAANRRDPAALDPIDRFVTDQRHALDALAAGVDSADLTRVEASQALLDDIEQRATELRRNLDLECPSATSIDHLGPLPGACVTLPAPNALGPSAEQPSAQPSQQQPAPDTGGAATPDEAGSDTGAPDAPSAGTDDKPKAPTAAGNDAPDQAEPAGDDDDPASAETDEDQAEDGGLLSGLNRLLGNLLGG